jgi:hypothetical protein
VTIPRQDAKPLFRPPPAGTLLVADLLFSAVSSCWADSRAGAPPCRAGHSSPARGRSWPFPSAGSEATSWFCLCKRMRGTAFAPWDTWIFVPLCLLLALGCLGAALSEH